MTKKFKLEGGQSSLDSFDADTILEEFEKQLSRPKKKKTFQPSIALPHMDTKEGIDWDKVNRNALYPCYEATKLPVGPERNAHCANCPECKAKGKALDDMVIPGNKWLDPKMLEKKSIPKEEIDWEI